MTTEELITDLQRQGVRLSAKGNRVCVDAPAGVITPHVRSALAARKAELLQVLGGARREPAEFHFTDGLMVIGDVCVGWTPSGWAAELRRKADRCDAYRPDIALYFRNWAGDIERRLAGAAGKGEKADAD